MELTKITVCLVIKILSCFIQQLRVFLGNAYLQGRMLKDLLIYQSCTVQEGNAVVHYISNFGHLLVVNLEKRDSVEVLLIILRPVHLVLNGQVSGVILKDILGLAGSFFDVDNQHLLDNSVQTIWDPLNFIEVLRFFLDELGQIVVIGVLEKDVVGAQLVNNAAKSPDVYTEGIGLMAILAALSGMQLLKRHVILSSSNRWCIHLGAPKTKGKLLGQAEISNLDVAFAGQKNVLRFEVSMNDAFGVQMVQRQQKLDHDLGYTRLVHPDILLWIWVY